MSQKRGRKIKTKTVRQMSVLGHKLFLQRLKTKANETNTNVIIVNESYTVGYEKQRHIQAKYINVRIMA